MIRRSRAKVSTTCQNFLEAVAFRRLGFPVDFARVAGLLILNSIIWANICTANHRSLRSITFTSQRKLSASYQLAPLLWAIVGD